MSTLSHRLNHRGHRILVELRKHGALFQAVFRIVPTATHPQTAGLAARVFQVEGFHLRAVAQTLAAFQAISLIDGVLTPSMHNFM